MSITCSRSLNVRAGKADDFPPGYTARSEKRKLLKHPNDKYIHISLDIRRRKQRHTRKKRHPTRDWNPAMVTPVLK